MRHGNKPERRWSTERAKDSTAFKRGEELAQSQRKPCAFMPGRNSHVRSTPSLPSFLNLTVLNLCAILCILVRSHSVEKWPMILVVLGGVKHMATNPSTIVSRQELIKRMAQEANLSQKQAATALESALDSIREAL